VLDISTLVFPEFSADPDFLQVSHSRSTPLRRVLDKRNDDVINFDNV